MSEVIVCPICETNLFLYPVEEGWFCGTDMGGCGLGFIFHPDHKLFFWKGEYFEEKDWKRFLKLRSFE